MPSSLRNKRSIPRVAEIVMHPEQSYGAFKEAPGVGERREVPQITSFSWGDGFTPMMETIMLHQFW